MRIYLNVPFTEQEEAISLGAKWDEDAQKYYYDNKHENPGLFAKWNDKKPEKVSSTDGSSSSVESLKEVCAYVRVSTDKQEELSPDSQIRLIKEYAQAHGMLLTHIYKEEHGISGKDAGKRPAFQEMIATCKDKSHPYDAILLWKFSRFARNIDESTYYKSILRKKCNVDVISISEPVMEGMYGRLIEMVIEWSDEFYLYNLSGEVMRGMTQNAMQGGYNANAPIGYDKEKGKIPVINPDEALIVRKIFDMFVNQQKSRADIATILNKQNIYTKRGGQWETRTISYVLENPFYIGKIRWNYFDRNTYHRKNADEVVIADGQHEAIIPEELFAAAGKRIATERAFKKIYGKKRNVAATKHWLSGMIKCSSCGASLAYNREYKQYRQPSYFQCWKKGKGLCDTNNYISAKNAEDEVISLLQEFLISNKKYTYQTAAVSHAYDNDIVLIKKELSSLAAKERRIKDAYMNGIDSLEEYRENKSLLTKRKEALTEQLEKIQNFMPAKTSSSHSVDIQHLLTILQDDSIAYEDKGNAIREVFDYFIWNRQNNSFDAVFHSLIDVEK